MRPLGKFLIYAYVVLLAGKMHSFFVSNAVIFVA